MACVIADSGSYDRVMRWSHSDDSYYDSTSGLCLWYNTDVSPNLWQYWYAPISGDDTDEDLPSATRTFPVDTDEELPFG